MRIDAQARNQHILRKGTFTVGRLGVVFALLAAWQPLASAAEAEPLLARFRQQIAPVLGETCGGCHDPETQEGGVVLTTLDGSMDDAAEVSLWKKVRRLVASRTMPPADADPLTAADIATLTSWIDEGFDREAERLRATTDRLGSDGCASR